MMLVLVLPVSPARKKMGKLPRRSPCLEAPRRRSASRTRESISSLPAPPGSLASAAGATLALFPLRKYHSTASTINASRGQRAIQQREDQFRDVTGCQARTKFGIGPAQHLGVHRSRTHADSADAVRPAFYGDRLRQADDPVLGDVVGGQAREL